MDNFSMSITGPFGSELIPNGLSSDDARDAATYFAMFISGENELSSYLEASFNQPLGTAFRAAIMMIVERARRSAEHAPAPALLGREDACAFVTNNLERSPGHFLSACEVYAAYVRWAREGFMALRTRRPIEARRFHHIVSLHFERIVGHGGVSYRDIGIVNYAAPLDAERSADQQGFA